MRLNLDSANIHTKAGASGNLGKNHSLTANLNKKDVLLLIPVNHRLELGAMDAIRNKGAALFGNLYRLVDKYILMTEEKTLHKLITVLDKKSKLIKKCFSTNKNV